LIKNGKIKFDLYLEVLTACLKRLTLTDFQQRIRPFFDAGKLFQEMIFDAISPVFIDRNYKLSNIISTFGALPEFIPGMQ